VEIFEFGGGFCPLRDVHPQVGGNRTCAWFPLFVGGTGTPPQPSPQREGVGADLVSALLPVDWGGWEGAKWGDEPVAPTRLPLTAWRSR